MYIAALNKKGLAARAPLLTRRCRRRNSSNENSRVPTVARAISRFAYGSFGRDAASEPLAGSFWNAIESSRISDEIGIVRPYSSSVKLSQARCASSVVGARNPTTRTNSKADRASAFTTCRHHLHIVGSRGDIAAAAVVVFVSIASNVTAARAFYGTSVAK